MRPKGPILATISTPLSWLPTVDLLKSTGLPVGFAQLEALSPVYPARDLTTSARSHDEQPNKERVLIEPCSVRSVCSPKTWP